MYFSLYFTLQYNLYAYCYNNPVNMVDFTGESPARILGAIAGGIGGYALGKMLAKELGLKGAKKKYLLLRLLREERH